MAARIKGQTPLKVLFIGNSFTARNDLPGMIAQLAEKRGRSLQHRLINVGGASLRNHWNAGEALKTINGRGFDIVVLQEQSTLPIKNAKRMAENIGLFAEAIDAVPAKKLLYMTWARSHAPETQKAITDAYTSIGQVTGATVVPVGLAWEHFLKARKQPVLHDSDGSHPTLAGSYLAACVFFAMLFGESPVQIETQVKGLDRDEMTALQQTAWQVCKSRISKRPTARQD